MGYAGAKTAQSGRSIPPKKTGSDSVKAKPHRPHEFVAVAHDPKTAAATGWAGHYEPATKANHAASESAKGKAKLAEAAEAARAGKSLAVPPDQKLSKAARSV